MFVARRITALVLPALTLAFALASPGLAHAADQTGTEGRPNSLQVNAPSSDAHLQFHGRLFVKSGNTNTEYRWGGTSCGSRTLTAEMVALLAETVRQTDITLVPVFQNGQGSTKCLVGFTIKEPKKGGGKPPSNGKPKPK